MHPLSVHFSTPIEREYESWIVQGIEQYFKELEICASVWAVSPVNEVYWPADEHVLVGNRIIGLQMKKVAYKPKKSSEGDFGRLYWSFQNPKAQYDLVIDFPEIYYCLPTFINRKYKGQAIHHCLFWRPATGSKDFKNAWYDNAKARSSHTPLREVTRWGLFVEKYLGGKVGKKFNKEEDARQYIESIRSYMENPPRSEKVDDESEPRESKNGRESDKSEESSSQNDDSVVSLDYDSIVRPVYFIVVPEK